MANGITIPVTADTAGATSALRNLSSQIAQVSNAQSDWVRKAQSVSSVGGAYQTVATFMRAMVGACKDLTSEYAQSARQTTTMQATIRALGSSCTVTSSDVLSLADSLSRVTTFSGEAIVGAQKLLLTTKNLSREGLQQATEATLDMAAALGQNATSAAQKLSKMLADPMRNLDSLKEVNIQFTESEKSKIKELQESGSIWEAQQVVLEKVKGTYGGIAKAVADTDVGKMDNIAKAMGDLKQGLGGTLVNIISPYLDTIYESIVRLTNWIDEHNKKADFDSAMLTGGSLDEFDAGFLTEQWSARSKEQRSLLRTARQSGMVVDGKVVDRSTLYNGREDLVTPAQKEVWRQYNEVAKELDMISKAFSSRNAPTDTPPKPNLSVSTTGASGASTNDFLKQYGSLSATYQIEQTREACKQAVAEWKSASGDDKKIRKEIKDALGAKLDALIADAAGDVGGGGAGEAMAMNAGPVTGKFKEAYSASAKYIGIELKGASYRGRQKTVYKVDCSPEPVINGVTQH